MNFFSLKDLVPKAAGKFQLQGELKAAMMINRASAQIKEVFSEEVERCIRVKRFSDGILWCGVSHPAVAQELQLKSHQLKILLNKSFGEDLIKQIRSFQESSAPEEDYSAAPESGSFEGNSVY